MPINGVESLQGINNEAKSKKDEQQAPQIAFVNSVFNFQNTSNSGDSAAFQA